tara:strand:- start:52156 stop:52710 length:555 start_codon:yes stop_codon:yes gene_type:complete
MEARNDDLSHIRTLLELCELGLTAIPTDVLQLILLHLFDIDPLSVLYLSEVCKAFHRAMQKPTIAAGLGGLCGQLKKDLAMVKQNGLYLEFVKYQPLQICMAAVTQNGYALYYVKIQTEEICMVAVTKCGNALKHVKNQTEKICMAAVTREGRALEHVKCQTEEICLAAIAQNGLAAQYVKIDL